jgi:integrase
MLFLRKKIGKMEIERMRRKVLLPVFRLSELTDQDDPSGVKRTIKQGKGHPALVYYYRFVSNEIDHQGPDYNLFPVVLDVNSAPWALANLYILHLLESEMQPIMKTYHSLAIDLGAFKEWLDSQNNPEEILFYFPKLPLRRATYRFRGFLSLQIKARGIAPSTANRRIGAVVSFYRWLIDNRFFVPEYPAWEEKKHKLYFKTNQGQQLSKSVNGTDLSIPAPRPEYDFDGTIFDQGKLRPLTGREQDWILEAIESKGNSECLLLHLFMIGTGARIESAATLRLRHFSDPSPRYSKSLTSEGEVYRLKAGPGTGIETKNNKSGTLQVRRELYELLYTYTSSKRSKLRQNRFADKNGPHPDPYLFVTQQGRPYYIAKSESKIFNANQQSRYETNGQTVRQFIKDHVIPYVRSRYEANFYYRPHDLRASFGMNTMEALDELITEKKVTRHQAGMILKDLLWHASMDTTDLYIDYKSKNEGFYAAINGYGEHLRQWTDRAMKGLDII